MWVVAVLIVCAVSQQQSSLKINVHYPDKNMGRDKLFLRGNNCGLSWDRSTSLIKSTTADTWYLTLACPAQNTTLELKVMYGASTWQIGSNTFVALPSRSASLAVDVYPWFFTNRGEWGVASKGLYSPQLKNTRPVVSYVPPVYKENPLKTISNVLIMHDGQNLFDPRTSAFGVAWMCQDTVDGLINAGKMDDVVIIGLYNTGNRTNEYTYSYDPSEKTGGGGDTYLDFIQATVLPWVKANFNVDMGSRSNVGILGSSLGGLISCYAGWTRSTVFGKAGCMSSSFWWNNEDFDRVVLPRHSSPVPRLTVYLDSGNAGPSNDDVVQTRRVRDHIVSLGYALNRDLFYYLDNGGQHSETYWGRRFYVPMQDLYPIPVLQPVAV